MALSSAYRVTPRWCRLSLEARESVNWLPSRLSVQLNRFPSVNVIPVYNSFKMTYIREKLFNIWLRYDPKHLGSIFGHITAKYWLILHKYGSFYKRVALTDGNRFN